MIIGGEVVVRLSRMRWATPAEMPVPPEVQGLYSLIGLSPWFMKRCVRREDSAITRPQKCS